ncbi:MAG: hypothetical protein IJM84_05315, partial [Bacteroidaceae bacterium]|nr:hypothetical protein [Bacteroidaceae bacterium]
RRPVPDTIRMDLSEQPDLAQTLVVTSVMLRRPFHFKGLQTLKIKETDRLAAMRNELLKFGVKVEVRSDSELLWDGSTTAVCANTSKCSAFRPRSMPKVPSSPRCTALCPRPFRWTSANSPTWLRPSWLHPPCSAARSTSKGYRL